MSLADELKKLEELRESGALSAAEFQKAKQRMLDEPAPAPSAVPEDSLGRAANRYVNFQMISGAIGLIIFLVVVCSFSGGRLPF